MGNGQKPGKGQIRKGDLSHSGIQMYSIFLMPVVQQERILKGLFKQKETESDLYITEAKKRLSILTSTIF